MLESAIQEFHLNLEDCDSYILGDKETDMQAGLKVGVQTRILIGVEDAPSATHRVANLEEAMEILL